MNYLINLAVLIQMLQDAQHVRFGRTGPEGKEMIFCGVFVTLAAIKRAYRQFYLYLKLRVLQLTGLVIFASPYKCGN